MITGSVVAVWLAQAPLAVPSQAPPVTPPPREWDLAGAFTLKQEQFLVWEPVFDVSRPFKPWFAEVRPAWALELTPTQPTLKRVSLRLESAPAVERGVGVVQPKLQFRLANGSLRVGVMSTVYMFSTVNQRGERVGPSFGRAMGFISGRF